MEHLFNILNNFPINKQNIEISPITSGLINNTFFIKSQVDNPDYILQMKNKNIFQNVPAMMENIIKVTDHIRKK